MTFAQLAERNESFRRGRSTPPDQARRILLERFVIDENAKIAPPDGTGVECTVCNGRGNFQKISDEGYIVTMDCTCAAERKTKLRLKELDLSHLDERCNLNNFRADTPTQKAMLQAATAYLNENPLPWFGLFGQSGAGKTHIATAIFGEVVRKRQIEGEFMQWGEQARKLKATALEEESPLFKRITTVPLLYVDDLWKVPDGQQPTPADQRWGFDVLNKRYNIGLPTIISCEIPFDCLPDEAIRGRIIEMCGPYLLNIAPDKSKNYRFRKRST